jgi:hypothetical protein
VRIVRLLRLALFLVSVYVSPAIMGVAHSQQSYNPFTQRLDQLPPPPGTPICSDWYREQALPKIGCTPDLIEKICSGQLPKVTTGPYCGDLLSHNQDMGKTCKTMAGECGLKEPTTLNLGCYCSDIAGHQFQGFVSPP